MLAAIAIIPSAPVLLPELAGAAADELTDLRRAVFTAAAALPDRWLALGAGPGGVIEADACGSFGGFGADVRVGLSPDADRFTELPLCALMTGWVRGAAHPTAVAEVALVDSPVADLRARVDASPEPVGVLVVADGANTLTPPAPGGYHPEDAAAQRVLDDALAAGDTAALAGLPPSITGRAVYAAMAALAGPGAWSARELYRGAPYGVGYWAGLWQA